VLCRVASYRYHGLLPSPVHGSGAQLRRTFILQYPQPNRLHTISEDTAARSCHLIRHHQPLFLPSGQHPLPRIQKIHIAQSFSDYTKSSSGSPSHRPRFGRAHGRNAQYPLDVSNTSPSAIQLHLSNVRSQFRGLLLRSKSA
jgi:hypothetical protein